MLTAFSSKRTPTIWSVFKVHRCLIMGTFLGSPLRSYSRGLPHKDDSLTFDLRSPMLEKSPAVAEFSVKKRSSGFQPSLWGILAVPALFREVEKILHRIAGIWGKPANQCVWTWYVEGVCVVHHHRFSACASLIGCPHKDNPQILEQVGPHSKNSSLVGGFYDRATPANPRGLHHLCAGATKASFTSRSLGYPYTCRNMKKVSGVVSEQDVLKGSATQSC